MQDRFILIAAAGAKHVRERLGVGLLFFFLLLLSFSSCRPRLPEGIMSEGKMERILYDFHMAQGMAENTTPDSGTTESYRYELTQAVYRKHGITEEEYERSMNYYCSDLQRLNKIYKNLEKRLEREALAYGQTNVRDVYANLTAEGDTANVWGGSAIMVVRTKAEENIQAWRQECDSTWMAGDELLWRFVPVSFSQRYARNITADLIVFFDNDSIRGSVRHGMTGRQFELRVANPEGWTPRAIAGHIYTGIVKEGQEQAVLAATEINLVRIHIQREPEEEETAVDSLATDSVVTDSIEEATTPDNHRRSPEEFRRQQNVDQKIDIVKEKPYVQPAQRGRRRMQQHVVPQRRQRRR